MRNRLAVALGMMLVSLSVGTPPVLGGGGPDNDAFANATVIAPGSIPYTDEIDPDGATVETEATSRCGSAVTKSTWWRITPTTSGYLRADTFGSGNDTDLTIYKGTTLAGLTEVACNDYATETTEDARVAFKVAANTRYYLRVTNSDDTTVLHLRTSTPPVNDAFASATAVTSLPFTSLTTNVGATLQGNEPDPDALFGDDLCTTVGTTIWYRLVPPTTMVVRADTFLSGFDTFIAVYRGTAIGSLAPVVCNDDTHYEGAGLASNVAFKATAGQTYYFQVGGFNGENSDLGVRFAKVTPPANDDFTAAEVATANGALHRVDSTRNATWQGPEPSPDATGCADIATWSSVWYTFTPSSTLFYIADTFGSSYNTVIAVYTGSTLGGLSLVGCAEGEGAMVHFTGTSGVPYRIQVSGKYGASGSLHFHIQPD